MNCNELPKSVTYISNNCELLFSIFDNVQVISSGEKGTTFKVYNKMMGIYTAIKIQPFDLNAFNELNIGCALNKLPTECFVKYITWFVCKSLPNWGLSTSLQTSSITYLFIEMDKVDVSVAIVILSRISLDYFVFVSIIFEIIYALYLARNIYSFSHNDLHANNILLRELDDYTERFYTLKDKKFELSTKYVPVIIDYDNATLNRIESSTDTHNLYSIFIALLNNIKGMGPQLRNICTSNLNTYLNKISGSNDSKDLEDLLLSDLFSGFITEN